MICMKCGCEQVAGAQFCRQCGVPIGVAVPPPGAMYAPPMLYQAPSRVRQNLQPLGIMWCIFGAYRIIAVLLAGVMMHTFLAGERFGGMPPFVEHMLHAMLPLMLVMVLVLGGAAILTGWALLTRRPWARVMGLVMAILSLIKIPFGTALGIYTLWVLAPQASGLEWDTIAPSEL